MVLKRPFSIRKFWETTSSLLFLGTFHTLGAPTKRQEIEKEKVDGILDCKVERNARGQFLVRGRIFDASKPQTFNQPWTPEEQRRYLTNYLK